MILCLGGGTILKCTYSLSPCGHVLCLGCLQNWFRSAPGRDDDMYDDDPDAVLYRRKTCPVCRSAVLSRPIPVFLVKSIAVALEKVKGNGNSSPRSSPPPEGDPWAGILQIAPFRTKHLHQVPNGVEYACYSKHLEVWNRWNWLTSVGRGGYTPW